MATNWEFIFSDFSYALVLLSLLVIGKAVDYYLGNYKKSKRNYLDPIEIVILGTSLYFLVWGWYSLGHVNFTIVSFNSVPVKYLDRILISGCFFILFGLLEKWLIRKSKGELKGSGLISYLEVLKQEKYKVVFNFWVIAGLILIGIWLLLFMQVR